MKRRGPDIRSRAQQRMLPGQPGRAKRVIEVLTAVTTKIAQEAYGEDEAFQWATDLVYGHAADRG